MFETQLTYLKSEESLSVFEVSLKMKKSPNLILDDFSLRTEGFPSLYDADYLHIFAEVTFLL